MYHGIMEQHIPQVTLADDTTYETGKRLVSGSVDISGQPSGTNIKYKIENIKPKRHKSLQNTRSIFALGLINIINS